MVAVGISLTGWLLSNFESASWLLIAADIAALLVIGFGGHAIHRRIEAKIVKVEEL